MPYTYGPEIMLPALEPRPWGRFIDVVPEISAIVDGVDRAPRGVKFLAQAALSPIVVDYTCGVDDNKSVGNLGLTETAGAAFLTFNLLECSTLSGDLDPLRTYVETNFQATLSEALAYAATTALTASHLNLAVNSTALAAATSLAEVIATIELGLAERISNQRGYIFISQRYLALAMAGGLVSKDPDMKLVSPSGHWVISDAGHHPYNVVYGTAGLGYSLTDAIDDLDSFDRSRNIAKWLSENFGLVVFNPAWSVRSTLTAGVSG